MKSSTPILAAIATVPIASYGIGLSPNASAGQAVTSTATHAPGTIPQGFHWPPRPQEIVNVHYENSQANGILTLYTVPNDKWLVVTQCCPVNWCQRSRKPA